MIRKVTNNDIYRIAEIFVFNNRINYYPIFNDVDYSFSYLNVKDESERLLKDEDFLNNTYIYEDNGVVYGYIYIYEREIRKLYVDSFFQNQGIGSKLIKFAKENFNIKDLWVLMKNEKAIRFYNRHGFEFDGKKEFEEGTDEYLLHFSLRND